MYTHEEAKLVKQKFWTSFGKYMLPVPSAFNEKVNWINYKTGIKGISFRMDADNAEAFISINFKHPDRIIQKELFDCFLGLKKNFEDIAGNDWVFEEDYFNSECKSDPIVIKKLKGIKIYRESDWPDIITFFKTNIIAIDSFWAEWKPAFEQI